MSKLLTLLSGAFSLAKTGAIAALPLVSGPLGWGLSILDTLWNSQIGRVVIVGGGLFLVGWVWGWNHERGIKDAAVAAASHARDIEWGKEISKVNATNEARIKEALDAARKVTNTPAGSALVELCRADVSCRGALAKGRKL